MQHFPRLYNQWMTELTFELRDICSNSPIFASVEFYTPQIPPNHSVRSEKMWFSAHRPVLGYRAGRRFSCPVLASRWSVARPLLFSEELKTVCRCPPPLSDSPCTNAALCRHRPQCYAKGTGDCVAGHLLLQPEGAQIDPADIFTSVFSVFTQNTHAGHDVWV